MESNNISIKINGGILSDEVGLGKTFSMLSLIAEQLNKENPSRQNRRQATEEQLNNPLHGVKLAQLLERLVDYYGWENLAERVNIRCFKHNPTMKSSLGFLRKTRWAREHVEDVYLDMLEEQKQ